MRRPLLLLLLSVFQACTHSPLRRGDGERFDSPDAAAAYDAAKRTGAADPQAAYATARARMSTMRRYSTADDREVPSASFFRADAVSGSSASIGAWTFLGPGNIGGRTLALLIDPRNPSVMYAGAISGGVWKTFDGGEHWAALADRMVNLQVSSLVFDPRDTSTLYAGTGEGFFREDIRGTNVPLRGDGVFVSHDAGASWTQLPSTASNDDFRWVNDVVVSVHDSRRLYAATRSGVWRSNDAGTTWSQALPTTVKGGCLDLALRTDAASDYVFASCGVLDQATVYRNQSAESSSSQWTAVLSEPGMSRTSLAISPSKPSTIYALAAAADQTLLGVYRSDQDGDPGTWVAKATGKDSVKQNAVLLSNPFAPLCQNGPIDGVPMGWHCNVIAVDPLDPERVWAAGVDLFRSDDGGKNWGIASYWWTDPATDPHFVHADQHAIVFDPRYDGSSNQSLFVSNDGGVYRTDNARAAAATGNQAGCNTDKSLVTWTSLVHQFGATQFYHGSVSPDGRAFFGGAQDNGSDLGTLAGGTEKWAMPNGGDGGFTAIDPVNPRVLYCESQNAFLTKSTDGGKNFRNAIIGLNDDFLFVTPYALDPNAHDRLWLGGRKLWRSDNAAGTWIPASTSLNGQVSAVAITPGNSDRVFAGTTTGDIVGNVAATKTDATSIWNVVRPRSGWVSSITIDPSVTSTMYATYAGFGGTHIWKSTDGGTNWTALDGLDLGTLPDVPVHSLALDPLHPGRLYAGTDLGIFVSNDGGAHWLVENSGFANVITEWVTIGTGERGPAIYAFTHGRGVWRAELSPVPARRRAAGK
jgi:photosystem II stability/assembly factor-like uncharacterized protein